MLTVTSVRPLAAGGGPADRTDAQNSLSTETDRKQSVAMVNAKEECRLRRCVSYLDRAEKSIVMGIRIDQKLILTRFDAMVRRTRIRQVGQ